MAKLDRPFIHVIPYGDVGMRKSTFAATFPKPMIVKFFDSPGAAAPYLRLPEVAEVKKTHSSRFDIPVWLLKDKDGGILIRIEFYADGEEMPRAMHRFRRSMAELDTAKLTKLQGTLVIDSFSQMSIAARQEQKYNVNPMTAEEGSKGSGAEAEQKGMRWGAGATEALETWVASRLPTFHFNVVLIAHHTEASGSIELKGVRKDNRMEHADEMVRGVAAPGRLGKSYGLFRGYEEVYHFFLNSEGRVRMQTEISEEWAAKTQIRPPNPCKPTYKALWSRYDKTKNSEQED